MTTSTTTVKHLSVKSVPLDGFGTEHEFMRTERFRDETVMERNRFALQEGIHPDNVPLCGSEYNFEYRGSCTRVGGSDPEKHHTGMHMAGNGNFLVGAW